MKGCAIPLTFAVIGGLLFHYPGAIIGAFIGLFFANATDSKKNSDAGTFQQAQQTRDTLEQRREEFIYSLIHLISFVIDADGKIMTSEVNSAKQFLYRNFGDRDIDAYINYLERFLGELNQHAYNKDDWNNALYQTCFQIRGNSTVNYRVQLFAYLCQLVQADGHVTDSEVNVLTNIAYALNIDPGLVDQLLHLSGDTLDDAYAVLGITADATDDEVKKAYRKMVLQHHPDKVASLGDDVKKAAEEKLRQINDAKERIYRVRGLS